MPLREPQARCVTRQLFHGSAAPARVLPPRCTVMPAAPAGDYDPGQPAGFLWMPGAASPAAPGAARRKSTAVHGLARLARNALRRAMPCPTATSARPC